MYQFSMAATALSDPGKCYMHIGWSENGKDGHGYERPQLKFEIHDLEWPMKGVNDAADVEDMLEFILWLVRCHKYNVEHRGQDFRSDGYVLMNDCGRELTVE